MRIPPMKRSLTIAVMAVMAGFGLCSCAEPEKKPVPPTTETSKIPWNKPISGQGQGQFGMIPQNQFRR